MRLAIASAALLLCSCGVVSNYLDPSGPRYEGRYAIDDSAVPERIKVVSFNVKFSEKPDEAAAELAARPLDGASIVLLQEMDAEGTELIAEALQMDFVYYPASVHKTGRDFGNAVLSRWPIVEDEKIILPHINPSNGQHRIAVRAVIDSPVGEVVAYSVHTETVWLGLSARLAQARTVVEAAEGDAARFEIVGGDFNTSDPGSVDQTADVFGEGGFLFASRTIGRTVLGAPFEGRLDHFFVRGATPVDSGKRTTTSASDHLPVWVELGVD